MSCYVSLTGQQVISGKLVGGGRETPIPFANIGILNTTVGTLSEMDGTFSLKVPEKHLEKEVLFSALGYSPKSVPVPKLLKEHPLKVYLDQKEIALDPIDLISEKNKNSLKTFGNGKSLLLSGQLAYDTLYAGSALTLKIDKSRYPAFVFAHKVSLYIAGNRMPEFKVRLRFLSVDTANNGKPGIDLFQEQIIAVSVIRKGWLEFKLPKSYAIEEDQFYLCFEWILDRKDRKFIAEAYTTYIQEYPDRIRYDTLMVDGELITTARIGKILAGTLFGTTSAKKDTDHLLSYSRESSFGDWERASGVLSAKIQLGNYPLRELGEAADNN
jgi:hypothetical protein